jgi:hypothetical protein
MCPDLLELFSINEDVSMVTPRGGNGTVSHRLQHSKEREELKACPYEGDFVGSLWQFTIGQASILARWCSSSGNAIPHSSESPTMGIFKELSSKPSQQG